MPEIFSTNTKFKLIEYGSSQQGFDRVSEIKDKLVGLLRQIAHK